MLLLLREGERRQRLPRLFFGLIDARLLGGDLRCPKVAIVEPHQDGARPKRRRHRRAGAAIRLQSIAGASQLRGDAGQ